MDKSRYSINSIFHAAASKYGRCRVMIEFRKPNNYQYIHILSGIKCGKADSENPISLCLIQNDNFLDEEKRYLGKVYIIRSEGKNLDFVDIDSFLNDIEK